MLPKRTVGVQHRLCFEYDALSPADAGMDGRRVSLAAAIGRAREQRWD